MGPCKGRPGMGSDMGGPGIRRGGGGTVIVKNAPKPAFFLYQKVSLLGPI